MYQLSCVSQLCVTSIWFFEFAAADKFKENDIMAKNRFKHILEDYSLHVLPFLALSIEFLTNAQPFIDRHFWILIFPLMFSQLVITELLELYYGIRLYMLDLFHLPLYNMVSVVLSIMCFYMLKGFSYCKLKI
jgi:hypothetical protein